MKVNEWMETHEITHEFLQISLTSAEDLIQEFTDIRIGIFTELVQFR